MSNHQAKQINQPGLILTPGPAGWWDSERVSSPQVMRDLDGTWKMWYYGRDASFDREINLPTGRCGLAVSSDGVKWERIRGPLTMGAVFDPHLDPNRFDSAHVGVSNVYFREGLYWMWYFGGDHTVLEIGKFQAKGIQMLPGCAVSRDGINWVRLEGPQRGAFLSQGKPGEFDALFCAWPQVLYDEDGTWKMYYHTLNSQLEFLVGLAVSTDGLRWNKVGQILGTGESGSFDERGIGTRHVLKIDNQYVMFYEGINKSGYHSIGIAVSDDGIKWYKQEGSEANGSVFSHALKDSGCWDAQAVGTPCVVPMDDGSFRMYYIGTNEGGYDELSSQHQIGLAVSDGSNFRKWYRWGV
ncbi:MAG: glycosyl hydrolase [Symploca sp. SIO2E9]|nr:glycosyl hydrolase [Symploca sp. SIO2E9]